MSGHNDDPTGTVIALLLVLAALVVIAVGLAVLDRMIP